MQQCCLLLLTAMQQCCLLLLTAKASREMPHTVQNTMVHRYVTTAHHLPVLATLSRFIRMSSSTRTTRVLLPPLPSSVYPDSIWCLAQVMKLLNVQFSAFFCYFRHLPQHPQSMFCPSTTAQSW
jgi:hypothetical protein